MIEYKLAAKNWKKPLFLPLKLHWPRLIDAKET